VTISRAKGSLIFPASFMLIGAMNPCPCGNFGHPEKECLCNPYKIQKYRSKISGPLLDRIDIQLEVPALKTSEIIGDAPQEHTSSEIRERVIKARKIQRSRYDGSNIHCNSQMTPKMIKKYCKIGDGSKKLLQSAIDRMGFSARAYDKILKVSRTIADLELSPEIEQKHIAEAIQYRNFDRQSYT
jgi:magnesium chelatase family protein